MFTFQQAQVHERETGHSVELFKEQETPNIANLFVSRYWHPPNTRGW